jgi:AraC-like DNA-binding protein
MLIRQYGHVEIDDKPVNQASYDGGTHPHYELLYITSGEAILEWVGKKYYCLAPALFVISPNTPHRLWRSSRSFSYWFVELELESAIHGELDLKDYINHLFSDIDIISAWNILQLKWDWLSPYANLLTDTLRTMSHILQNQLHLTTPQPFAEMLSLDLRKLLSLIYYCANHQDQVQEWKEGWTAKSDPSLSAKQSAHEQIFHLIRYIEGHFTSEITLFMLSERSGFTPSYIIKLFKEMTGCTPLQYVHNLRMKASISYLQTTEMPIKEIAEATGFLSLHYYSRLFKQTYGVSPSHWRKTRINYSGMQ